MRSRNITIRAAAPVTPTTTEPSKFVELSQAVGQGQLLLVQINQGVRAVLQRDLLV